MVQRLREAGHVAYFAGGCVRDALLGLHAKDYDIATSAAPEAVRKLFPRSRYVGEAFGVVLVESASGPVEVATFRIEWGYADGRRPSHVAFTDARHDAMRRDFTVNGLFEDPLTDDDSQRIIDHVGGVRDLNRRVLRAIGRPEERFAEDYLRMLRAVRFAARLAFRVERRTAMAIQQHAPKLEGISRERIGAELRRMLAEPSGPRAAHAARLMQKLRLDAPTLREDHCLRRPATLARLDVDADFPTALAAWMLDRHLTRRNPDALASFASGAARHIVRRWRTALCLSNDQTTALAGTLDTAARLTRWGGLPVAQRKRALAHARYESATQLLRALSGRFRRLTATLDRDAPPLLAQGVAPMPLVTGDDLVAMGRRPSPAFAKWLTQAYDEQLEGRLVTKEQALDWVRRQS